MAKYYVSNYTKRPGINPAKDNQHAMAQGKGTKPRQRRAAKQLLRETRGRPTKRSDRNKHLCPQPPLLHALTCAQEEMFDIIHINASAQGRDGHALVPRERISATRAAPGAGVGYGRCPR